MIGKTNEKENIPLGYPEPKYTTRSSLAPAIQYKQIPRDSKQDTTRSSLSLAKHFIKKSPCSSSVLIVENGKVRLQDYLQRK